MRWKKELYTLSDLGNRYGKKNFFLNQVEGKAHSPYNFVWKNEFKIKKGRG